MPLVKCDVKLLPKKVFSPEEYEKLPIIKLGCTLCHYEGGFFHVPMAFEGDFEKAKRWFVCDGCDGKGYIFARDTSCREVYENG